MVLLFDSDVPYDTPDWTYDGAAIAGHIAYVRTLLLEDLAGVVTILLEDDPSRVLSVENTRSDTETLADLKGIRVEDIEDDQSFLIVL